MTRLLRRPMCVSIKLSPGEFELLSAAALTAEKTTSEWARDVLLCHVSRPVRGTADATSLVLAEVLALRGAALNLMFALLRGERMTKEQVLALLEEVDNSKAAKAAQLLSGNETECV